MFKAKDEMMKLLSNILLGALVLTVLYFSPACPVYGGEGEEITPERSLPQLDLLIPVSFEANRLVNIMDYFRNVTGAPIEVDWPELEKWNVADDTLATLSLHDVPAGRAIELTLQNTTGNRLALLLHNGEALHITMRRKAERLVEAESDRWSYWNATPEPTPDEGPSPHEAAVTRIGKTIPWNFERNRIVNIVDYIRHTTESNLYVDWVNLSRLQVHFDTQVTAMGEPQPASRVLDSVLQNTHPDLAWRIDDFGIVIISTRDGIERMFPAPDDAEDGEADSPK